MKKDDSYLVLSPKVQALIKLLIVLYILVIVRLCFGPQPVTVSGVETPNIRCYGRLVVLLTPFNSFQNFSELDTPKEIFWVIGQNVVNVFLLTPLIYLALWLKPKWRSYWQSLRVAFLLSLGIECTQLLIDYLWDANRVFEVDDLWTNALGGLVAFALYRISHQKIYQLKRE